MELVMFSKMLKRTGGLSVAEAGNRIADLGFDGVDLTVRPGGHVDPEAAADRLPEAVATLEEKGLSVPMVTTSITGADEAHAEEIFAVADAEGVDYLKLGYWDCGGGGSVHDGIGAMRENVEGIREMAASYDVTPAVHTHSGDFLSANPALFWETLREGDPENLGIYVDPGHLTLEGGLSGRDMTIDLVGEYVTMVSVKDVGWFREESGDGVAWEHRMIPLDEGMVPWGSVFDTLRKVGFDGPVSIHSEYGDLDLEGLLEQTEADVAYLRRVAGV
jgi:sugar phosphate isomerase/epimerase